MEIGLYPWLGRLGRIPGRQGKAAATGVADVSMDRESGPMKRSDGGGQANVGARRSSATLSVRFLAQQGWRAGR